MPIWTLSGSAPDLGTVVPVQDASTVYTPPVKVAAAITVTLTAQLNDEDLELLLGPEHRPGLPRAVRLLRALATPSWTRGSRPPAVAASAMEDD
ncbi:hypothetical protein [Anaeromyxobacter paludicola]|uniref:hypothetical protein n=1 Tax=Anaeromyxobacter paludicola TaxID=2918171 RepID=UPI0020BF0195|nr:hypothetical protein [Anaeromyxobacter paludicola]